MKHAMVILTVLCLLAPVSKAGPNAGGTLVVHDAGLAYSSGMPLPPVTAPPADCASVDHTMPPGSPAIWKVFAAFPDGSNPRLKALAWGIAGEGAVYVLEAGLPDPPNCFQVVQGHWPSPPGSIGQSFVYTQTSRMIECYWFAGYGEAGAVFRTVPHVVDGSSFVDDAVPGNVDNIAGFSTIGFGVAGNTVCAWLSGACCFPGGNCQVETEAGCLESAGVPQGPGTACIPNPCPSFGACCDLGLGSCRVTTEADCVAQGFSYIADNTPCTPNPCPQPPRGACCYYGGYCSVTPEEECVVYGGIYWGDATTCSPNPCPQSGSGACCDHVDGHCWITSHFWCALNDDYYVGNGTDCQPNPCTGPTGACCFPDGTCLPRTDLGCTSEGGILLGPDVPCAPNPCPQPAGACCLADGSCAETLLADCTGFWQIFGTCTPNPCPQPSGACCFAGAVCQVLPPVDCAQGQGDYQGDDVPCTPNPCPQLPPTGACCFPDGVCQVLTEADCAQDQGAYQGDDAQCTPNPCPPPTPIKRTSWGQIKATYR